jgi:2-methylcitrate dehydratase PrpD
VRAALLASWGYDSSTTAFEGKFGFFNVMAKKVKPEEVTRNIGEPFCLSQIVLKPYPCCGGILSPIYAALELVKKNDIPIDAIESAEVLGDPQVTPLLNRPQVRTGLDGKFSIQYCVALALAERKVKLDGFTDDKIKDLTLVNLMNKTKVIPDSRMNQTSASARSSVVEVKLKDGRKLSNRCDYTPGTPQNPLPLEELLGKYRDCAGLALSEAKMEESIELLMHLEDLSSVNRLFSLIGSI